MWVTYEHEQTLQREQIALFLANTFEGQLNDDDVRDPHLDN